MRHPIWNRNRAIACLGPNEGQCNNYRLCHEWIHSVSLLLRVGREREVWDPWDKPEGILALYCLFCKSVAILRYWLLYLSTLTEVIDLRSVYRTIGLTEVNLSTNTVSLKTRGFLIREFRTKADWLTDNLNEDLIHKPCENANHILPTDCGSS